MSSSRNINILSTNLIKPADPVEVHDETSLTSSITIDPQLISDIAFNDIDIKMHLEEDSSDAFTTQPPSKKGKGRGKGKGKGKQLYERSSSRKRKRKAVIRKVLFDVPCRVAISLINVFTD
ncbi:uncharacterized protein LOC123004974 [Tribolium madens]|uniref:uncharacterized protein LOC123004974 n=1 Tax=Tribolium madens TaxID=41895 RepID=UPI001CF738A3|nr:uncharacterized protein LOC123004974 [Tribolium madens]XP_044254479.1 uncharacterized protein LOC123004974 [Tribolium madens]